VRFEGRGYEVSYTGGRMEVGAGEEVNVEFRARAKAPTLRPLMVTLTLFRLSLQVVMPVTPLTFLPDPTPVPISPQFKSASFALRKDVSLEELECLFQGELDDSGLRFLVRGFGAEMRGVLVEEGGRYSVEIEHGLQQKACEMVLQWIIMMLVE
jgi:hypothetical protein